MEVMTHELDDVNSTTKATNEHVGSVGSQNIAYLVRCTLNASRWL